MNKIREVLLDNYEYFLVECAPLLQRYKSELAQSPVFKDEIRQQFEEQVRLKIAEDLSRWTAVSYSDIMEELEDVGILAYLGG